MYNDKCCATLMIGIAARAAPPPGRRPRSRK